MNTIDFKNLIQCINSNHDLNTIDFDYISIDSRTLISASKTLFFAFDGSRKKGVLFIPELIEKGVRFFVLDKKYRPETESLSASFFLCK